MVSFQEIGWFSNDATIDTVSISRLYAKQRSHVVAHSIVTIYARVRTNEAACDWSEIPIMKDVIWSFRYNMSIQNISQESDAYYELIFVLRHPSMPILKHTEPHTQNTISRASLTLHLQGKLDTSSPWIRVNYSFDSYVLFRAMVLQVSICLPKTMLFGMSSRFRLPPGRHCDVRTTLSTIWSPDGYCESVIYIFVAICFTNARCVLNMVSRFSHKDTLRGILFVNQ